MSDNKQVVLDAAEKLASESLRNIFTAKGLNLETGISLPTIYKYLEVLEAERKIVVVNPDRERGRYYRLPTDEDRKAAIRHDEDAAARQRLESDPYDSKVLKELGFIGKEVVDYVVLERLLELLGTVTDDDLKEHIDWVKQHVEGE